MPADSRFLEFLRSEILANGPVPFPWFMEQALYHPEFGYYRKDRVRVGIGGDYYTSVSVGAAYGLILAEQIREMHEALGRPEKFTIVEAGAEDGQLAADILSSLGRIAPDQKTSGYEYVIVEPFPEKQRQQKQFLGNFTRQMRWVETMESIGPQTGVVLASELLDAFPVHLVEHFGKEWRELRVNWSDNRLGLEPWPVEEPALAEHLEKLPIPTAIPYRTEVNLRAADWMQETGRAVERGFVLVIDYGYCREEYYSPQRTAGTLTCYRGHHKTYDPLEAPGQMDMTAHVDFTTVVEAATAEVLGVVGFADQHHFMVGAGEARLRTLEKPNGPESGRDQVSARLQDSDATGHDGNDFQVSPFEQRDGRSRDKRVPLR